MRLLCFATVIVIFVCLGYHCLLEAALTPNPYDTTYVGYATFVSAARLSSAADPSRGWTIVCSIGGRRIALHGDSNALWRTAATLRPGQVIFLDCDYPDVPTMRGTEQGPLTVHRILPGTPEEQQYVST